MCFAMQLISNLPKNSFIDFSIEERLLREITCERSLLPGTLLEKDRLHFVPQVLSVKLGGVICQNSDSK